MGIDPEPAHVDANTEPSQVHLDVRFVWEQHSVVPELKDPCNAGDASLMPVAVLPKLRSLTLVPVWRKHLDLKFEREKECEETFQNWVTDMRSKITRRLSNVNPTCLVTQDPMVVRYVARTP